MEIEQFRVTVRARNFERTSSFYGETLAFPHLDSWEHEGVRANLYQAGSGEILVLGRTHASRGLDEAFEYRGPQQKMEISLTVDSAQEAYDELIFRQKNIPGGMVTAPDGSKAFMTYDPDGVKLLFREAGR